MRALVRTIELLSIWKKPTKIVPDRHTSAREHSLSFRPIQGGRGSRVARASHTNIRFMKRALLLAVCLTAFFLIQVPALSQTTGGITGTVKDPTGAVITDAIVTGANKATSETRRAITDSAGSYSLQLLPPGHYLVTVAAKDFATRTYDDVQVALTETTLLHVGLALETVTKSITVQDATPIIQKDRPQLGRVVDPRSIAELPLATRNFTQMLA